MTTALVLDYAPPTHPVTRMSYIRVVALCVFALAAVDIAINRYTAGATVFLEPGPIRGNDRDAVATIYFAVFRSHLSVAKRAILVVMAVMTAACLMARLRGMRVALATLIALMLAWLAIVASNLSPTAHWTALSNRL